jgi:hypothetical protein
MANYNRTSPYFKTSQDNGYLDTWSYVDLPVFVDDILFEVTSNYEYRPDLLAYDLYGDVNLWWVFAVRNKSVIKDPVYDLEAGIQIYLPKMSTIETVLGV